MANILIIGGSGFVGQNVVSHLLAEGHAVSLLNRGNNPLDGTKQIIADRENIEAMNQAADQIDHMDVIIDTSALMGFHTEIAWNALSDKTSHWIHLSSASVYKEKEDGLPTEEDAIGGAAVWGEYGAEKAKTDMFLIERGSEKAITIFRPPYLYGPKDPEDRANYVWHRCLNGEKVAIPGNGQTSIQFLHIQDLARAMTTAIENPSSLSRGAAVYNVASPELYTLAQWVETVAASIGKDNPGVITNDHQTRPRDYFSFRDYPCALDVGLIEEELGWTAQFDLPKGLQVTLETCSLDDLKSKVRVIGKENQILTSVLGKKKLKPEKGDDR